MDGGYHQVCVSMSQKFLDASKTYDRNDLSSVVSDGGHWCICAWAWASAVSRDPNNMEGITIDCERTNAKLRQVYELHIREGAQMRSPSGQFYKARDALDALNRKCPPAQNGTGPRAASAVSFAHDRKPKEQSLRQSVSFSAGGSSMTSSHAGAAVSGAQIISASGTLSLSALLVLWHF